MPPATEETRTLTFYADCLRVLHEGGIPFLVGGAYVMKHYVRIARDTKDMDLFLLPDEVQGALYALESAGYETDLRFPHWLAKVYSPEGFVDIIFNSGNGATPVDRDWFRYAEPDRLLGRPVLVCPPEEAIWSKSFVMERERYDGSDVAHLLCAVRRRLDWRRLVDRFGANSAVLLSHLVLLGFIYPSEANDIPDWVMDELWAKARAARDIARRERVCGGTLLSREQYLIDLERGYRDARLAPRGTMSAEAIAAWTAAIHGDNDG
jgi:hypothetical protein